MNLKNRLLSLLLATIMIISTFPLTAYADDSYNGTGSGDGGGGKVEGSTYSNSRQGLRIYAIDSTLCITPNG